MLGLQSLARRMFGSVNERKLKSYQARVVRINALEPNFEALSDDDLRATTAGLKARLANGETLDDVLEEVMGSRLIRPAAVKAPGASLPNWPTLDEARGKFLLILDEGGAKRETYLNDWRQRPMFTSVGIEHPAAAVMIVNDPIKEIGRTLDVQPTISIPRKEYFKLGSKGG